MSESADFGNRGVEHVLVVAEDAGRLRAMADRLWAAECIAYCARSSIEAVALVVAGLRPKYVLVDAALGATCLLELRATLCATAPDLNIEVAEMPSFD